jgi:hypothetical protein
MMKKHIKDGEGVDLIPVLRRMRYIALKDKKGHQHFDSLEHTMP